MQTMIRRGREQDIAQLRDFLEKAQLGTEGVEVDSVHYFIMLEDEAGNIKGTLGVEPFGSSGLLRSLVITPGMGEKEIFMLFEQMLLLAKEKEMNTLIMATNKQQAIPLFEMLGFAKLEKHELPVEMEQSNHVQYVKNVDNSLFLKFSL